MFSRLAFSNTGIKRSLSNHATWVDAVEISGVSKTEDLGLAEGLDHGGAGCGVDFALTGFALPQAVANKKIRRKYRGNDFFKTLIFNFLYRLLGTTIASKNYKPIIALSKLLRPSG